MQIDRYFQIAAALSLLLTAGCGSQSREPKPDMKVVMAIRDAGGAAAENTGPAAVLGDGWGTLKGKFVFDGTPPAVEFVSTGGKDGQVCDAHPIPNQSLVVDPQSKGIANIVVFLRKASRIYDELQQPPTEPAVFDQKECVFLTHVLPVRVGQPVEIKNSDPIGHNTNISPPGDTSTNNLIPAGSSIRYSFNRAQNDPVPAVCSIHPWMKAFIMPRKDPYVAATKPDGSFEIPKLPAGEPLEFQVWQERRPKGLQAKPEWAQGRFKVTIPKDNVLDLGTIAVPASALQ